MSEPQGSNVGTIYLSLKVKNDTALGIDSIAVKAQKQAESKFQKVGAAASAALNRGMEKAGASVTTTFDKAVEKAQEKVKQLDSELRALSKAKTKRETDIYKTYVQGLPSGDISREMNYWLGRDESFGKLKAQIQEVNAQYEAALNNLEVKTQAAAEARVNAEKQAAERIKAAKLKQMQAEEQAAAKAKAAAEKAEAAKVRAAERAEARQKAAADRLAAKQAQVYQQSSVLAQKAYKKQSSTASGFTSKTGSMFQKMGKTIASSFKAVMITSVLYAAFRGLKALLNSAVQSNQEFSNSLNSVKANLSVAFTPIIQSIMPALNTLMSGLATATKYIATFISALFGKTYAQSVAATKSLKNTTAAAGGAAAAAKKLSTAGFDELEKLNMSDSGGGGGGGGASGLDFDSLGEEAEGAAKLAEKVKAVWDRITEPFKKINFQPAIDSFNRLKKAIEPFAKTLFSGLEWFITEVLAPLTNWVVTEVVPRFFETLAIAVDIANTAVQGAMKAFEPLWEDFLKPVAKYAGEKFIAFWDKLNQKLTELSETLKNSKIFDDLKSIFEVMAPIFERMAKIWIDIKSFIGELALDASWELLLYYFHQLEDGIGLIAALLNGDWSDAWEHAKGLLNDNKMELINNELDLMKEKFELVKEKVTEWYDTAKEKINGFVDEWSTKIEEWWTNNVEPWFTIEKWEEVLFNIGLALGNALADAVEWWNTDVSDWWENDVKPWFTIEKWKELFSCIKEALSAKWKEFSDSWGTSISNWWNNKVKPWFTLAKWRELGTNIKNGLINGFKGAVNGIVDILNGVITAFNRMAWKVIAGVNSLVSGFNNSKLSDITGWKIASLNFGGISTIPYMANGGIISQPTLAMVGEYAGARNNPEVVAPLDKLQSMINNADDPKVIALLTKIVELLEALNLVVYIGDDTITNGAVRGINKITAQTGKCPVVI